MTHLYLRNLNNDNMKIKYLFIASFLILLGCNKYKLQLQFKSVEQVEFHKYENSPFIGLPIFLEFWQNNLVISDFYGDSLLHLINLENHNYKRIGPVGQGPNEFLSPLQIFNLDTLLYIYSKNNRQLGYFYETNNSGLNELNYKNLVNIELPTSNIFPLSEFDFIATGYFEEGRYASINLTEDSIYYFGEYPDFMDNEIDIPYSAKAMFHQAIMRKHPINNTIISVSSHIIDIIEICDNYKVTNRKQLSTYGYDFSTGEVIFAHKNSETTRGVIYFTVSNEYIYLLYDNSKNEDKKENNEIWVFDWDLNPIKKMIPSVDLYLIAIENNLIYGVANNPEPTIYISSSKYIH